jgi:hypothetical protein
MRRTPRFPDSPEGVALALAYLIAMQRTREGGARIRHADVVPAMPWRRFRDGDQLPGCLAR